MKNKVFKRQLKPLLSYRLNKVSLNSKGERIFLFSFSERQRDVCDEIDLINGENPIRRFVNVNGCDIEYTQCDSDFADRNNFNDAKIVAACSDKNIKIITL